MGVDMAGYVCAIRMTAPLIQIIIFTSGTFETSIPSMYIGAIIGRNGETVRALQDTSGCRIDIERYCNFVLFSAALRLFLVNLCLGFATTFFLIGCLLEDSFVGWPRDREPI